MAPKYCFWRDWQFLTIPAFPPPPQPSPGFAPPNFSYPPPPRQSPPPNGPMHGAYPGPPVSPPAATPPVNDNQQYAQQQYVQQNALAQQQNIAAAQQKPRTPSLSTQSPPAVQLYGAPAPGQFTGAQAANEDSIGTFNGGSYRISHRDSNSLLTLQLAVGCPLIAKPGMMTSITPGQNSTQKDELILLAQVL